MNGDDSRAAGRFLKSSGRLEGAEGLYGSDAYKELVARRAAGAGDADVQDLVEDLAAASGPNPAMEMAAALALAEQVENRMGAEGPPEGHEHGAGLQPATEDDHASSEASDEVKGKTSSRSRSTAKDLGWG